jgi:flagellar hook-length control protein FliK
MVRQGPRVRPQPRVLRHVDSLVPRAEKVDQFAGNPVVRHQQAVVLADGNQAAVEQPVDRRREGETVLDHVRAVARDRLNVSCLDFGPPAAIDDAQALHRPAIL